MPRFGNKAELSRCYCCDELCSDEELQKDIEGWKVFEAFCQRCIKEAQLPNYEDIIKEELEKPDDYGLDEEC